MPPIKCFLPLQDSHNEKQLLPGSLEKRNHTLSAICFPCEHFVDHLIHCPFTIALWHSFFNLFSFSWTLTFFFHPLMDGWYSGPFTKLKNGLAKEYENCEYLMGTDLYTRLCFQGWDLGWKNGTKKWCHNVSLLPMEKNSMATLKINVNGKHKHGGENLEEDEQVKSSALNGFSSDSKWY